LSGDRLVESGARCTARHDPRDTARIDRDAEHNFLPDFAWAAVGGAAFVAACALLLILTAALGVGPVLSAYGRELSAAFLAGFLVVLVARSLTAQSR
jgi:hypothetical protein